MKATVAVAEETRSPVEVTGEGKEKAAAALLHRRNRIQVASNKKPVPATRSPSASKTWPSPAPPQRGAAAHRLAGRSQEEFRAILLNNRGLVSRAPLDRLVAEFFERSVKPMDVCNAIWDGIEQVRQWQKYLEIVFVALDHRQRAIGEGQRKRKPCSSAGQLGVGQKMLAGFVWSCTDMKLLLFSLLILFSLFSLVPLLPPLAVLLHASNLRTCLSRASSSPLHAAAGVVSNLSSEYSPSSAGSPPPAPGNYHPVKEDAVEVVAAGTNGSSAAVVKRAFHPIGPPPTCLSRWAPTGATPTRSPSWGSPPSPCTSSPSPPSSASGSPTATAAPRMSRPPARSSPNGHAIFVVYQFFTAEHTS